MRKGQCKRSGQTAILFALGMTTMFGVIGLVSDVGYVYYRKQNAQAAAQSAAIAAVQQAFATGGISPVCNNTTVMCNNYSSLYTCPSAISGNGANNFEVGCLYAKSNGYSGGQVTIEASTTTPREGVSHLTYWATVRVSEHLPLLFSSVIGSHSTTLTARSTAAYIPPTGSGCIYVLATTGSSLTTSGGASITSACGVWDDSSDSAAINLNGQNASITATGQATVQIVGTNPGYSCYGGTLGCITPAPTTGAVNSGDPLSQLPAPSTLNATTPPASGNVPNTTGTVIFSGNVTVNNNQTLNLSPGTYIFENCNGGGGLKVAGQGTITGTGVFLYFEGNCTPSFNAGATINLTAPTSGPYDGVLIFQARNDSSTAALTGGANQNMQGIVYFPDAQLNYAGGSSSKTTGNNATMIANTMQFSGSTYIWSAASSPYTTGVSGVMTIE